MTWWCFIAFVFWISLHLTWLSIFRSTAQLLFQISGSFPLRPCQQWILWNPRLNCTTQPCFKKVIENAEFTIFLLLNSTLNPTVIITTTTTPHNYFWTTLKKGATDPHDISNNFHQIFHKNEATEKKPIENYGMVFFFHHEE